MKGESVEMKTQLYRRDIKKLHFIQTIKPNVDVGKTKGFEIIYTV